MVLCFLFLKWLLGVIVPQVLSAFFDLKSGIDLEEEHGGAVVGNHWKISLLYLGLLLAANASRLCADPLRHWLLRPRVENVQGVLEEVNASFCKWCCNDLMNISEASPRAGKSSRPSSGETNEHTSAHRSFRVFQGASSSSHNNQRFPGFLESLCILEVQDKWEGR